MPESAVAAQPFYTQLPQPSPILEEIPDTVSISSRRAGEYLLTVLPYYGVAIWEIDSTTTVDTVEVGFISLPGMLSYVYFRDTSYAVLSQSTAHYSVDFSVNPPSISDQIPEPAWFDPFYYLAITATSTTGTVATNTVSYYFNCPDPDLILAGFRREKINTPTCRLEL